MRIGIDARLATRGLGIAQFILNLTEQIASSADVTWFGEPAAAPRCVASVRSLRGLPYPVLDSPYGRWLARKERIDVFHFTGNTGWTLPGSPPFVLTVHDLIFLDSPVRRHTLRQVVGHRYARWVVRRAIGHASAVVTVSETSAKSITRHFPDVAVRVIPNATDASPREYTDGKNFEFAVVFSSRDPRKAVELAYRAWVAAGRTPPQLKVLAGGGVPEGFCELAASDLESGAVEMVGYLDRAQLLDLIQHAGVLLYPSTQEGFALPVLEAMAMGTPVIAGLAPVTLEVGGPAIARIDPADPVPSISRLLRRMGVDADWRRQLVQLGQRRARNFSWSESGRQYLELYKAICT